MLAEKLIDQLGIDYYTGVPDSQLRGLCDALMNRWGIDPKHHLIAANEGNAVAMAAGYHLATGKTAAVYMQNSGEGNAVNPLASLTHGRVYGIPMVLIVGWRGEPGVHDEPQHVHQGAVTLQLLELMDIPSFILSPDTSEDELADAVAAFQPLLREGRVVALVVRKGALTCGEKVKYTHEAALTREEAIAQLLARTGDDPIVSTTGKASRELFELREARGENHSRDFLTVGSMGHASSIALAIATHRPGRRVWCVDGDGAALMHLGAMATIGSVKPANLIHLVLNNAAHETVGGMPTVAGTADLPAVAAACGYPLVLRAWDAPSLDAALTQAREAGCLTLVEVAVRLGSRADLGRPTTTPKENKQAFMARLAED